MSHTSHVQFNQDWDTDHRRSILTKFLHQGPCEVTFVKVDGSTRIMPCTLQESLLPPAPVHVTNTDNPIDFPTPKKEKKPNPGVMSVWCLDKSQWRSFKVDNVLEIREIDQ